MKATKIIFGRTKSVNYQSQHVSVEIELEEGEKVTDAISIAKAMVARELGEGPTKSDVERARAIIEASAFEDKLSKL